MEGREGREGKIRPFEINFWLVILCTKMLLGESGWSVHGELLAANVVRLSWTTTRDVERSSTFSDVGDAPRRVWLRSDGPNSTLQAVRLLNGSTMTACDDESDGLSSVLIDCHLVQDNNSVMLSLCCDLTRSSCNAISRTSPTSPSLYVSVFCSCV